MNRKTKKINFVFIITVLALSVVLWKIPTGFENSKFTSKSLRARGRVLSVDNQDLKRIGAITTGTQAMRVRILSGTFKGQEIQANNVLMGQMSTDKFFKTGDHILLILKTNPQKTKVTSAGARDLYRIHIELILFFAFALFLVLFAGRVGAKALLSFVFTALMIWKILIPFFLKGYSPVFISLAITLTLTAVIILLINGFCRKSYTALAGAVCGVLATGLMAVVFGHFFRIPGTAKDFAEMLIYSGFGRLNLSDIFISGIFIAAAGAVMDVAMDIAAAQEELISAHPEMNPKELIHAGFRIGRVVIGTMTTTLLFAYSSQYIFMLMIFMSQGIPMETIFCINFVAGEVLHTVVGSFGLVLVAPITAVIGGFIYTRN